MGSSARSSQEWTPRRAKGATGRTELGHVHGDIDHHVLGAAADGEMEAVARIGGRKVVVGRELAAPAQP